MWKILKYSFSDLFRGRWMQFYFFFYLVITSALVYLSGDSSKVAISLMNVILVLNPLISAVFGIMFHYNSREFTELLLAQPIKRRDIFLGQYLGLSISLSLSFALGLILPLIISGLLFNGNAANFIMLLLTGISLTFIFSAFSFWIGLRFSNKIKGFGLSILFWLFMAVIYDGLILALVVTFSDYPLEKLALTSVVLNPIDLSRMLILLKLDISALMGYTGAVFNKFFGSNQGIILAALSLVFWFIIPTLGMLKLASKKDF